MAQIRFPTKQAPAAREGRKGGGAFGQQAGAIIGGVAGAMTGSPIAAAQGAASGASMGGMAGNVLAPGRQAEIAQRQGQTQGIQMQQGAIDRRLSEIDNDPHFQLQQAKAALPQLSPDIQKEYGPAIEMALAASRNAQKVGAV